MPLGAVPVVFVVQRPGSFAAEHIVLLDARHIVAQKDEQHPAAAADQNTDQAAASGIKPNTLSSETSS